MIMRINKQNKQYYDKEVVNPIPNSASLPQIIENHSKIRLLIDKICENIQHVCKKKEDVLLETYKDEMIRAQRALRDLSQQSAENEIRKDMLERNEALEKEREKYVNIGLDFTKHCEELKLTLQDVTLNVKELETEIRFLDEQILYSDKQSQKLQEEIKNLKDQNVLVNEEYASIQSINKDIDHETSNKKPYQKFSNIRNYAQMKVMKEYNSQKSLKPIEISRDKSQLQFKSILALQDELQKQKEINEKLNKLQNNQCFQESQIEALFNETVINVIQLKQSSDLKQLNYQTKKPKLLPKLDEEHASSYASVQSTKIDYSTLDSDNFNEYYKRKIFEEFLEREEVKQIIHNLMFEKKN